MATKTYVERHPIVERVGIDVTFTNGRKKIVIENFNDDPMNKFVSAKTDDGVYTLWSGDAYTNIADWTTTQAVARVRELALAGVKK